MKLPYQYWISISVLILSLVGLAIAPIDINTIYAKLQGPLFTGFLTVGGFLLTLKTFILVKLNEGIYKTDTYRKRFESQQALDPGLRLYGPLQRLSEFLVFSVLSALSCSACQLILGSFGVRWANIFCLSLVTMTLTLVFFCWWEIQANLKIWFSILEEERDKEK